MHKVALALVWECWRLARRWYVWVLALAVAIDMTFMGRAAERAATARSGFNDVEFFQVLIAPGVVMMNFTLAVFATLLAISIGSRAGFPLAYEFRLPVRTPALVALPVLTLATLCASLYCVPILLCRLYYGIALPVLPAGALIGGLVIVLLACSWSTATTTARTLAMLGGMFFAVQVFNALDPVNVNQPILPGRRPQLATDMVALSPAEYALLGTLAAVLIGLAIFFVGKQRQGEPAFSGGAAPFRLSLSGLFKLAPDLVKLPCPVSSPWRAELWLELKRQVMPVLVLSALIAAAIPLYFRLGLMPDYPPALRSADYVFPSAVFFAGIGMAVFNRRLASAGYMSAFEGTRGMSTLQLASIQVLSVSAATLAGMLLVCISLYYSSLLLEEPGDLALSLRSTVAALDAGAPLFLLAEGLSELVIYVSAVMLLVCVHTWSVVWGRWVPYGAGVLAIYGMIFAFNVQTGNATLDDIKRHMWAFAAVVFLLTLFTCGRTLYLRLLSPRTGLAALLCWGVFVACTLYSLTEQDIVLTRQASELQAFNAALLVTPLLLFMLLMWSYDRLRHR